MNCRVYYKIIGHLHSLYFFFSKSVSKTQKCSKNLIESIIAQYTCRQSQSSIGIGRTAFQSVLLVEIIIITWLWSPPPFPYPFLFASVTTHVVFSPVFPFSLFYMSRSILLFLSSLLLVSSFSHYFIVKYNLSLSPFPYIFYFHI